MRTREESLKIISDAIGGNAYAANDINQNEQNTASQQNNGMRSREESLRIIQSAMGGWSTAEASPQPSSSQPTIPQTVAPSTSSGAYAPPSPQGEGRSVEQIQQEISDSRKRLEQLQSDAAYVLTAEPGAELGRQMDEVRARIKALNEELDALNKPNTNAERDSLIRRMNDITAYEGYATTVEQADEVTQEKQDTRQRLHELDEELGNAARFYDSGERTPAVVKGALKRTGAELTGLMTTLQGVGNLAHEASSTTDQAVAGSDYAGWATDELTAANMAAAAMKENPYGNYLEGLQKEEQRLYEKAVSLSDSAEKDIEQAKEGLSALGKAGVDISVSLIQNGIDAAGKAVGLGMLPFFARAAGGAMLEARQAGASTGQQVFYGLTKGGIEAATELLAGGIAGTGVSGIDKVVEPLIDKLAKSTAGKIALNAIYDAAMEGTEEVFSDLLDPFAKLIYNDRALKEAWENRADIGAQMLYDYLIGAVVGSIGSATQILAGAATEEVVIGQALKPGEEMLLQTMEAEASKPNAGGKPTLEELIRPITLANDISAEGSFSQGVAAVEDMLRSGRVSNTAANEILNNASLSAQFEDITGITLDGTREENRRAIQRAAREYAYNVQTSENAAETAAVEAETEEAVRTSGYGAYIRGVLKDGATVNIAREIINNPEMRSTWEQMTGKTLPENQKSAVKMIMQTRRANPVIPEQQTQQRTYPTVEELIRPITPANDISAEGTPQSALQTAPLQGEPLSTQQEAQTQAAEAAQNAQRATPQAETQPTTENAAQAASDALNQQAEMNAQEQETMGAETETQFNELAEKYGAIPTGEAPAREVQVPQRISEEKAVGRTARTIMEAEATPDKRLGSVREAVVDGKFSYTEISNRELADSAAQRIQYDGWQKSLNDWTAAVRQNQANENLAAIGAQLLNNAGNSDMSAEQYIDLATDYNRLMHNLGRGLAAAHILKTLTPEGKLYGIQRSIQSMVDEANGKYKVEIDPALIDEYRAQTTDEGRDAVISKMQQNIADQIPSTWADKFTALRYTNMLGNFKTQIRNVGGNVLMTLTRVVKDKLAAVIENAAYAASGGKIERTKSLWAGKALHGEAMRDFLNVEKEAMGESKFSDTGREFGRDVQEKRKIFKINGKWGTSEAETGFGRSAVAKAARKTSDIGMAAMEMKRKVTNWAMEQGDRIFVRINYADALAGWLNAHGISSIADADIDTLDRARQYAIKQAQEATFRDTNSVSQFVSTFDKGWGKTGFGKGAQKVMQGIAPFRKTPANVAVRAEEYSPLGILNTAYKVFEAKQGKNDVTWADVIDSAAKTLTGSGIFALGYLMSAAGSARGKEDDEKKAAFEDMQGLQDYSIVLPNGKTISLDWAAPDSIPFFMGVLTQKAVADGGLSWDDAGKIIGAVSDPMLEMSMLSGLNDALDNISRYNGDADALPQFLMNSFASYLSQGLTDTLLGQFEQASQDTRQTTYTDPESKIPSSLQYILGKASAKTPGVDYNQQDYIDAWGRKQSTGTVGERIINSFINPAYISEDRSTPVDDELKRLYDAGQTNVFPQKAARSTQVNGVRLSPEEYEAYSITKGQQSLALVQDFIESDAYKDMDDDARAKIISDLYSFAASRAAKEVANGRKESYASDWDDEAKLSDVVGYLTSKSQIKSAQDSKDYSSLDALLDTVTEQKEDVRGKLYNDFSMLDELIYGKEHGVDSKTVMTAKEMADTNGSGSISQEELWFYLGLQKNMPEETKDVLWDILTTGKTGYSQYAEKQK